MVALFFLPLIFIIVLVMVGLVFAGRSLRSTERTARTRSPLPDDYRRLRRMRALRWIGAAAAVALIGSLWAWLVHDPVPADRWF